MFDCSVYLISCHFFSGHFFYCHHFSCFQFGLVVLYSGKCYPGYSSYSAFVVHSDFPFFRAFYPFTSFVACLPLIADERQALIDYLWAGDYTDSSSEMLRANPELACMLAAKTANSSYSPADRVAFHYKLCPHVLPGRGVRLAPPTELGFLMASQWPIISSAH